MARIFLLALLGSAAATAQTETVSPSSLRYDLDYPTIAYSATPRANEIARLQSRLNRGEVRLTMDSERGAVFYSLPNQRGAEPVMQRETNRCLSCHDTFSKTGGGVPRFLFLSAPVDAEGLLLPREISIDTDDRTPLARRWGGWYVTGQVGHAHRGNADLQLDTRPYLSDRSDVVALLVLEHQLYIKNLITRLNFKTRSLGTSPRTKRPLQRLTDQLLEAMLFVRAASLTGPVRGDAGFEQAFMSRGPRDASGRSLRDFDLKARLFRYPLSYVIYSEGFDALPEETRRYLYVRLAAILDGRDASATFSHLSAADRTAIREILLATKPEFAQRSKELLPRPAAQLGELGELPGAQAHEEAHAVTLRGG